MSIIQKHLAVAATTAVALGGGSAAVLAASAAAATPVVTGTGSGSATLTVTGPAGQTGQFNHMVSCDTTQSRYVLTAHGQSARASTSFVLTVPGYNGAGSYTGTIVVTRHSTHGSSLHHAQVPVTLTDGGGSIAYTKTLAGKYIPANAGKQISAQANWTCTV
jgi:hypothetical protein